jgi:acyl-CoA synthetase (NDP forming)
MLHPGGLAVFGAVHEPGKFGHMILQSLLRYGYGGTLYPIHSGGGEVLGLKVYPSLEAVPGPVDLACVCVPADAVPGVLRVCAARGVAGAEILSSGFAETGTPEGKALQAEIVGIARTGIRILGPNCFGAHCPKGGITILPGFDFAREPGTVAFMSQSGGVAADFGHEARTAGFGLSKVLSFGNGCDLDAASLLDYFAEDPDTTCVGAYLEGVPDGRGFMGSLKAFVSKKPAVIWKGGLTPFGRKSVQSHTGSMGGEARIWQGLLAQAGALAVEDLEEMVDAMTALTHFKASGRRIGLVGGGGAIGVYVSDLAYRWGLELPTFSAETQSRLGRWFPTPGNSMANPVDTGSPVIPSEAVGAILGQILRKEPVDTLVLVLLVHPLGLVRPTFMEMDGLPQPSLDEYLEAVRAPIGALRYETGKDVVVVLENRAGLPEDADLEKVAREARLRYFGTGIPVFPSVRRALRAVRISLEARPYRIRS